MSDPFAGLEIVEEDDPFAGLEVVGEVSPPAPAPEPDPKPAPPPAVVDTISARRPDPTAWEAFLEGATNAFNLGDELRGVGAKAAAALNGGEIPRAAGRGMDAPVDPRTEYEVMRDRTQANQADAARAHPWAYGGGQMLTETAATAIPAFKVAGVVGKALPRVAPIVRRAAQSAVVGGPLGALAGWGASTEEEALAQLADAGEGLLWGTAGGIAGGELGHQLLTRGQGAVRGARRAYLNREAHRISASHGEEAAQRMLHAVDPDDPAGAPIRQQLHAAESPEALSAHEQAIFKELEALGPPKDARELARRGADPAVVEAHTKDITDKVSGISKNLDAIQDEETIAKKTRLAAGYFQQDGVDPYMVVQHADGIAQDIRRSVQEMIAHTQPGTEEHRLLKRIEPYLLEYDRTIATGEMGPIEIAGRKWGQLDQLKRDLQKKLREVKFNSIEVEQLNNIENKLRTTLEDPGLWGQGAADLQVRRNRAWHRSLSLEQTRDTNPRREFLTDARGVPSAAENSYRSLAEGDPAGIHSTLKGAATVEGEIPMWKLAESQQRRAELADALTDHIEPDEAMRALAADSRNQARGIQDRIAVRNQEAAAARDFSRLPQAVQDPTRAASLVRNAGGSLPDPELEALRQFAESAGKDITPIESRLAQRAGEVRTADGLLRLDQNLPDAPAVDRFLNVITGQGNVPSLPGMSGHAVNTVVTTAKPEARTLGQRARLLAQLEDTLRREPGNEEAKRAIEALRVRAPESSLAARSTAASVAGTSAGEPGASKGHQLEGRIRQVLATDRASLGPYAEALEKARKNGTLGAELFKLEADPEWRTRFKPGLQR